MVGNGGVEVDGGGIGSGPERGRKSATFYTLKIAVVTGENIEREKVYFFKNKIVFCNG